MNMVQRKIEFDSIFVGLGWFLVILIRYCYDNLFFFFNGQGELCRISSVELRIRNDTERVLRESRSEGPKCACGKGVNGGSCRNCLMRDVTDRLRKAGHDSAVCKSKWRRSPDIPSGTVTAISYRIILNFI